MKDVAIIGCGVIGAAATYALSKYRLDTVVLEREYDVSCGTSKANSAILHAGYDPPPGSLMARLNVRGVELAAALCEKLDVPYLRCGSLVLGFSEEDRRTIETLFARGNVNGVPGLEIWDAEKLRAEEPEVSAEAICALHAPSAAIVSPWEYTLALAETAVRNGVEMRLNAGVTAIEKIEGGYRITTEAGVVEARYILNAAGVHADAIHNMVAEPAFTIRPDRGEYYLLDKCECYRARRTLFQCPTKIGKGVLVSPTVHGNLLVGPNNEKPEDGDDVATTREGLAYVLEHARKTLPGLGLRDNIRTFSGNRAHTEIDDFIIGPVEQAPGFIDMAGIKSPGLSAAPAIAEMVVDMLGNEGLRLERKASFTGTRKRLRFNELSSGEKAELVQKNPAYGRVICRCETVTEGEILDALATPIPPRTLDGVKRRCSPGMGRCQGGFCGPRVVEILSKHYGVSPLEIEQDKAGSYLLNGETKGGNCRAN